MASPPRSPDQMTTSKRLLVVSLGAAVAFATIVSALWFLSADEDNRRADLVEIGVETFRLSPSVHVDGEVAYAESPPVGGNHSAMWLNCGYYSNPVVDEMAVHSLEHGAAWITYRPGLSARELSELKELAREEYTLVSPYDGLDSAIVVATWGKQLQVDFADDPALRQFLDLERQGPDTPEPGAPCTNGVGRP